MSLQDYLTNDPRRVAQREAEAKLEAEEAKKLAEHEARAEAMAAAEQARVKQMIRANFVGTVAEFESAWPILWQQWRDAEALQRARDDQARRRDSIASRF